MQQGQRSAVVAFCTKIKQASVDRFSGVSEIEYFGLYAGCHCWYGVSFSG